MSRDEKNSEQRPMKVTGDYLDHLRMRMGVSVADFIWLFGVTMPKWSKMKSTREDENGVPEHTKPVPNPEIGMLARFYRMDPSRAPYPEHPTPLEIYELLSDYIEISKSEFALAMGRDTSIRNRWFSESSDIRASRPIQNILLHIKEDVRMIESETDEFSKRAEAVGRLWSRWRQIVEDEARSRGIANIWEFASWQIDQDIQDLIED